MGSNMDKIYIVMNYVEHDLKSLMETMKQPFLPGEPDRAAACANHGGGLCQPWRWPLPVPGTPACVCGYVSMCV